LPDSPVDPRHAHREALTLEHRRIGQRGGIAGDEDEDLAASQNANERKVKKLTALSGM
jgi:hypothetical protein